jgi:hypothetical protein
VSDQVSHPYKTTGKIIVHVSCPLGYICLRKRSRYSETRKNHK